MHLRWISQKKAAIFAKNSPSCRISLHLRCPFERTDPKKSNQSNQGLDLLRRQVNLIAMWFGVN